MVCLSFTKLQYFFCLSALDQCVNVSRFLAGTVKSAEDAIAEQAKQQEDDPYANLSKKEKKKKKKQVALYAVIVHWLYRLDLLILHLKVSSYEKYCCGYKALLTMQYRLADKYWN